MIEYDLDKAHRYSTSHKPELGSPNKESSLLIHRLLLSS